jgi:hypothetical protein
MVRAEKVGWTKDAHQILYNRQLGNKFAQASMHKRKQAQQKRKRHKFGEEQCIICTAHDYHICPHECRSVCVDGYFETDQDWLVEKNLLVNVNGSYLAVPNVLISSTNPWVPISNPSNCPMMIRRGEAIGRLTDPSAFFDKWSSTES